MAEAFYNQMAKGTAQAYSAGTQPAEKANSIVVKVMKEVGIDISGNKPKMLTADMMTKANKVITMGCGTKAEAVCPASFIKTDDWTLKDPEGKTLAEVREIRDEIKEKVAKPYTGNGYFKGRARVGLR